MPAYKDDKGKWYCKFYYTDYSGIKKQKKNAGFTLRKEALAWERDFIENHSAVNNDISFDTLLKKYLVDVKERTRAATYERKESMAKKHVFGVFDCPASEVTPLAVKEWQYTLKNKGLAPNTIRAITTFLSSVFNWGISFCGLSNNPVKVAKHVVSKAKTEYNILTRERYDSLEFSRPSYKVLFDVLFYTGMRLGECLALTVGDVDGIYISITKSKGKHGVSPPKTQNSVRKVPMPGFLAKEVEEYIKALYGADPETFLFPFCRVTVARELSRALEKKNYPKMRIHDLRHSHASLMIELGCNILLVAERLGDTPNTALSIYSHLYPDKQESFVEMIEK